jgi:hypothetical protein
LSRQNQKCALYIPLGGISFPSPVDGREDEELWLFETLAHNLLREPERGSDFLTYIARNPLKRLDSQK